MKQRVSACCILLFCLTIGIAQADPPSVAYIFPAGGQRGTTTHFKVGGYNLHGAADFEMLGAGVEASKRIELTDTLFFEGPVIPLPDSQRKEDYPRDYDGQVKIAADAAPGVRSWHVTTSQGITSGMKFLIGDLPEVVEEEIDGDPIPTEVELPVTINGRIHPREDVDIWTFHAQAGRAVTCEVHAARIGSPLDSRIEVRDPTGRPVAENIDAVGTDSRLRFVPAADGEYEVRIHDVSFEGLQNYVYRLTVTDGPVVDVVFPLGGRRGDWVEVELSGANLPQPMAKIQLPADAASPFAYRPQFGDHVAGTIRLDVDDLPEHLEPAAHAGPRQVELPAACNGRIAQPGEVDRWSFTAVKDKQYQFEILASRLGSPLDSVLTLFDAGGKQLAQHDDLGNGRTDSQLAFQVPADGIYNLHVEDRLPDRGGLAFAYRLKLRKAAPEPPGFRLSLPSDVAVVERGKELKLKINVERLGGFQEEIHLTVDNLPNGVALAEPAKVGKGKNNVQLTLKAEGMAAVTTANVVVRGNAEFEGKQVESRALFDRSPESEALDELRLRVAVPTPFKFTAEFATKYASRGTVFSRHYELDRGGFAGPIEIRLADIQIRHLQGVKGSPKSVPPDETEFDYSITLPPWLEIGRTSRTCLMAVGEVTDPDGSTHTVCFSSTEQNEQVIILADPGRLSVRTSRASIRAMPGSRVRIPFEVERANDLRGPVKVDLVIPRHIGGVTAEAVEVASEESSGELVLSFAAHGVGPFNMPLTVRAVMPDEVGNPVTAEIPLTVVCGE